MTVKNLVEELQSWKNDDMEVKIGLHNGDSVGVKLFYCYCANAKTLIMVPTDDIEEYKDNT